jgi:four helix bundle protein
MAYGQWELLGSSAPAQWQILPRLEARLDKTGVIPIGPIFGKHTSVESRIIAERAFRFGVRIVKLCEKLWARGGLAGRKIADQLFDSGTSIGANSFEAEGGQTKPDFLAKLAVSRKESWETIYWLQLGIASSVMSNEEVAWELDEAQQLKAMITAAIKTGQSSPWRGAN